MYIDVYMTGVSDDLVHHGQGKLPGLCHTLVINHVP